MSEQEFTSFLRRALTNLANFSIDGSIHFVCMDWRHIRELADAADDVYTELKNICVWSKSNAGMGSLYRSAHEFIFVYKHGRAKHINNVELGRFGRSEAFTNIRRCAAQLAGFSNNIIHIKSGSRKPPRARPLRKTARGNHDLE